MSEADQHAAASTSLSTAADFAASMPPPLLTCGNSASRKRRAAVEDNDSTQRNVQRNVRQACGDAVAARPPALARMQTMPMRLDGAPLDGAPRPRLVRSSSVPPSGASTLRRQQSIDTMSAILGGSLAGISRSSSRPNGGLLPALRARALSTTEEAQFRGAYLEAVSLDSARSVLIDVAEAIRRARLHGAEHPDALDPPAFDWSLQTDSTPPLTRSFPSSAVVTIGQPGFGNDVTLPHEADGGPACSRVHVVVLPLDGALALCDVGSICGFRLLERTPSRPPRPSTHLPQQSTHARGGGRDESGGDARVVDAGACTDQGTCGGEHGCERGGQRPACECAAVECAAGEACTGEASTGESAVGESAMGELRRGVAGMDGQQTAQNAPGRTHPGHASGGRGGDESESVEEGVRAAGSDVTEDVSEPGNRRPLLIAADETVVLQLEPTGRRIVINPRECLICCAAPREVAFDCGHHVCCARCAGRMLQCPMCRQLVRSTEVVRRTQSYVGKA